MIIATNTVLKAANKDAPRRLLSIGTDRLLFEVGSAVAERFKSYAREWDEIHIIVATPRNFAEKNIAPNVWLYPTRSRFKLLYPFDTIRLGRFIIEKRGITDITCQDPFLTGMAGVSLKKQSGLPLELQVHTDIGSPHFAYSFANRIRKSLALSYLQKADTIRVVSNRIAGYLTTTLGIDLKKITIRPIAVPVESIRNAPISPEFDLHKKYGDSAKIVLMVSRFEKEKNIGLAIKAFKEVKEKIPQAKLVIVGSGSEMQRLKVFAIRSGLMTNQIFASSDSHTHPSEKMFSGGASNTSNSKELSSINVSNANNSELPSLKIRNEDAVIFEPWTSSQSQLISYYKTADVFLNTSLFEGYGMTLVEARAAGTKIVSTDVGVAREVGARIVDWNEADAARGIIESLGV